MRNVSNAEKIANIEGDWRKALSMLENERKPTTMDWLGMEAVLRAYIRQTKDANLDRIVAEFTLRGYELPE